jgi:hypothetical protein
MKTFTLPTGRQVSKDATYCVAILVNGRWSHKWFKSYKGATNEMSFLRNSSADTKAYYGIERFYLLTGEEE